MMTTATINAWAGSWAVIMNRGLIDASILLLLVALAWLVFRRRMSSHLACGLFLLVPLKLALPIPVTIPWGGRGPILAGCRRLDRIGDGARCLECAAHCPSG
ncbi:hypothetical protein [Singulisphaera sp. PoT]|uniref:hypothetical protein n=1 Tax=Singulisphaera sp. PoT TaxID=3411797 RepID=UPI003BF55E07